MNDTLDMFTKHIKDNIPFAFVKFGDGELACINGDIGENCDNHPYTPELAKKLRVALYSLSSRDNVYIAKWNGRRFENIRRKHTHSKFNEYVNLVEYQLLLSIPENFNESLRNLYRAIRDASSSRKVIFIIPEDLDAIPNYITSRATVINIPKINAFSVYDTLMRKLLPILEDDAILITACGLMSKSIISDVMSSSSMITCLDFGSAFDPLLVGVTRLGQGTVEEATSFFNSI